MILENYNVKNFSCLRNEFRALSFPLEFAIMIS